MNFLSPWLLVAFGVLPLLWWLIRSLPPRAHIQSFSSLILLRKLSIHQKKAVHTPFWLLLLRLLAISCLITGLAGLYKAPIEKGHIPQKLLIIMDNGWASMPQWSERQQAALQLGLKTLHHGGTVSLVLSAQGENGQWAEPFLTTAPQQFETIIHQLKPSPWPSDRHHLAGQLSQKRLHDFMKEADSAIISDGLAEPDDLLLRHILSESHHVMDIRWPDCTLTALYAQIHETQIKVMGVKTENCPLKTLSLKGLTLDHNGHFIPLTSWPLQSNTLQTITIAPALYPSLHALALTDSPFPAALSLLKAPTSLLTVGLLRQNGDDNPLTGDMFYLERALKDFTKSQDITPQRLKGHPVSVLIASDESLGSKETRAIILDWVRKGGLLIRFAGPQLAKSSPQLNDPVSQSLMTVPLEENTRSLGGTMSWNAPQTLAPFAENTPLSGLQVSQEITIKRQLIARPSEDLPQHVLASLKDGTPLITTRQEGKGRIVLFHITPTADWSNLPLSGLFPQILERLINHIPHDDSSLNTPSSTKEPQLSAWKTLSPQGTMRAPGPLVAPLKNHETATVSAEHPVGFYGTAPISIPLNLIQKEGPLPREAALGILTQPDFRPSRTLLGPFFILASLILLLIDSALSLAKTGSRRFTSRKTILMVVCAIGFCHSAQAGPVPPEALQPRLGYILSGDSELDQISQEGLNGLTHYINQRSTTHLGPPRGIVPGQDNLAFYPVLYWPLSASTHIDDTQAAALNDYMAHNGLLMIDEMGAGTVVNQTSLNTIKTVLTRISQRMTVPPLVTMTDETLLARTFYLLHSFPGRIAEQPVYTARTHFDEGEDISPIIIGNNDWAHAWAIDDKGHTLYAVIPDDEEQRVQSYRFGMNIVIYALTGNYKYDQRFYPEMLKRLGAETLLRKDTEQNDLGLPDQESDEP